jgi:thioredoxin reductase (NADPH)
MSLQEKVKNTENIQLVTTAQVVEISGEKRVEGIKVSQSGEIMSIEVSGVFAAIGSIPNTQILSGVCDLDQNGYIIADEDGITSREGFFAAGDVRTKNLRQVVTAVSDGACCVISAEKYLR